MSPKSIRPMWLWNMLIACWNPKIKVCCILWAHTWHMSGLLILNRESHCWCSSRWHGGSKMTPILWPSGCSRSLQTPGWRWTTTSELWSGCWSSRTSGPPTRASTGVRSARRMTDTHTTYDWTWKVSKINCSIVLVVYVAEEPDVDYGIRWLCRNRIWCIEPDTV